MLTAFLLASALAHGDPINDALAQIKEFDQFLPYRKVSIDLQNLPNGVGRLIRIEQKQSVDGPAQQGIQGPSAPPTRFETFYEQLAAINPGAVVSVPWQDLKAEGDVATHDLGIANGYQWIARSTIPFAMQVKQRLGTQGGEELRALAAAGTKDDADPWTRSQMPMILNQPRFEAVVFAELDRHDQATYGNYLQFLQHDFDSRADGELIHAFWHGGPKTRNSAAWTLISQPPYRETARTAYLEMVRRGPYAGEAAQIVGQLKMTQALPDLDRLWQVSSDFSAADSAYRAARTLRKKPKHDPVESAFRRLVAGNGSRVDLRTYRQGEPVYAAVLAIETTFHFTKGGPYANNFRAMHLLHGLHTRASASLVARFRLHPRLERMAEWEQTLSGPRTRR